MWDHCVATYSRRPRMQRRPPRSSLFSPAQPNIIESLRPVILCSRYLSPSRLRSANCCSERPKSSVQALGLKMSEFDAMDPVSSTNVPKILGLSRSRHGFWQCLHMLIKLLEYTGTPQHSSQKSILRMRHFERCSPKTMTLMNPRNISEIA